MIDKQDVINIIGFLERDAKCAGKEAYAFVKAHVNLQKMLEMFEKAEKVAAQPAQPSVGQPTPPDPNPES